MQGLAYRVGDFRVRLGRVAQRPGDRIVGLALDASYPPLGPSAPPQETAPVLQVRARWAGRFFRCEPCLCGRRLA